MKDESIASVTVKYHDNRTVKFYFNKLATTMIDGSSVVIDKTKMRIRYATVDDMKTYTMVKQNNGKNSSIYAKMPNWEELLGVYEVEDEGNYFQLYKVD